MTSSQISRRWPGVALLLALLVLSFLAPKRWDSATLEQEEQGLSWPLSGKEAPEPIPLAQDEPQKEGASRPQTSHPAEAISQAALGNPKPGEIHALVHPASQRPLPTPEAAQPEPQSVGPRLLLPSAAEAVVQSPVPSPLVAPKPSHPEPITAAREPEPDDLPVRPAGELRLNRPVAARAPAPVPPKSMVPQPGEATAAAWSTCPPGLKRYLEAVTDHRIDPKLLDRSVRCSGELYQRVGRGEEIEELCQQQRHLESQLRKLADSQPPEAAAALRRLAHALARRRVLWQSVARLTRWQREQHQLARHTPQALLASAVDLEQALQRAGAEEAWQRFLLLPELKQQAQAPPQESRRWERLVAEFLNRVDTLRRDPQYERLSQWEQLQRLQRQLCLCALGRFEATGLPQVVEQFEQTEDEASRALLVRYLQLVEHGSSEALGLQPWELVNHWNNTNLRLAVHHRLLAQLVPQAPPRWQRVYDTILGIPVRGRSWTTTRVDVRTLPGQGARLVITARGLVRSWTQASQGLVTTHERTVARFSAQRLIQLRPDGLRSWPTRLELDARSELAGIETELDGLPLLGDLVREIALSQREEMLPEAQAEARWKLRRRIQAQFDRQVDQALAALDRKRMARLNQLRKRLRLDPLLLAHTTSQRLVLRVRLAGPDQLGAHTPRPRALAGSWASLQVHQSAINNVLDRLQLAGRRFTMPELERHLQSLLDVPVELGKKERRAAFRFAQHRPVVVHMSQGKVWLHIHLAELVTTKHRWQNLSVQVGYRPVRKGRWFYLQREGHVKLQGQLGGTLGSSLIVRGIFNRIFPSKRQWPLFPPAWEQSPLLDRLAMTQCVVEDGWLGISLGPKEQLSVARRGSASEARPR